MGAAVSFKTCMFVNSPDEHFIVDALPEHRNVVVAAGFSGHGYKFCAAIGEILADLSMHGTTPHDTALFRLSRPALGRQPAPTATGQPAAEANKRPGKASNRSGARRPPLCLTRSGVAAGSCPWQGRHGLPSQLSGSERSPIDRFDVDLGAIENREAALAALEC